MKRLLAIALTAGMTLTASLGSAQGYNIEHTVRIEGPGFFPNIVYANVGDTIKFENYGPYSARVQYSGYGTNWFTNAIGKNSSTSVTVTTTNTIDLKGPYFITGSSYFGGTTYSQYGSNYGLTIKNALSNPVPLSCPNSNAIC